MKRVEYTPRATDDLFDIWLTISRENERAAAHLVETIRNKFRLVADNPAMGKPHDEIGERVRSIITGNYLALYEEEADKMVVLAIIHGAREPGTWLS